MFEQMGIFTQKLARSTYPESNEATATSLCLGRQPCSLYSGRDCVKPLRSLYKGLYPQNVQGYLAHKNSPTPLGPPWDSKHRPSVGSYLGYVCLWARYPCEGSNGKWWCPTQACLKGLFWGSIYRRTYLTRKHPPLGPYHRPKPGVLGGSWGGLRGVGIF